MWPTEVVINDFVLLYFLGLILVLGNGVVLVWFTNLSGLVPRKRPMREKLWNGIKSGLGVAFWPIMFVYGAIYLLYNVARYEIREWEAGRKPNGTTQ